MTRACLRPSPDVPHPSIFIERGERKTIGRSPQADVVLDEPSLSRLHAAVQLSADGELSVEDLGSTNGVFVNRARQQSGPLALGDQVVFGILEYRVEEAPVHAILDSDDSTIVRSVRVEEPEKHIDAIAMEGLLATSRELMGFTDLKGLLERVLDRLQPVLKPDRSAILLFDAASGDLTTRAVRPDGAYTSISDFASSTIVRESIRRLEVIEVCDAALDARLQDAVSLARAGVRSAICVPLLGRTGPIGALYADQMWYTGRFTPEQVQYAAAFATFAASALETAKLYDDRERQVGATLESFARAIDARDKYTAGHSERVAAYTLVLARVAGTPDGQLETLRRACMLHDIGKVGVPDRVLLKPGPLDPRRAIDDGSARHDRVRHARAAAVHAGIAARYSRPSRALGWQGLSGRCGRREHSPARPHHVGRRQFRRDDVGASLSSRAASRRSGQADSRGERTAIRARGRRSLRRRPRGAPIRSRTGETHRQVRGLARASSPQFRD